MLTVACVYVKGPYPYSADYVMRLERMVRRFVSRPFRFVCFADLEAARELAYALQSTDEPAVAVEVIASLGPMVPTNGAGYWNKVRLFDPRLGLRGRVLFLDLDSLIVAPLDPIIDYPASLALTADAFVVERAHLNTDRYGRRLVRRFNSSVMVWDGGTHTDLWSRWTPDVAQQLSTDQDWIGEQAEDAQGLPLEWFPRISHLVRDETFAATGTPMPPQAKVILCKKPKNADALQRWPWIDCVWGGSVAAEVPTCDA